MVDMTYVEPLFWLLALAIVAWMQNAAFTWTSRSRNSGDPAYHRYAAWCSNGVWLICHLLVWKHIWGAFESGNWGWLIPMFVVYVLSTTEGSVYMMKVLLRTEDGKRKVGAGQKEEKDPERDYMLVRDAVLHHLGFGPSSSCDLAVKVGYSSKGIYTALGRMADEKLVTAHIGPDGTLWSIHPHSPLNEQTDREKRERLQAEIEEKLKDVDIRPPAPRRGGGDIP